MESSKHIYQDLLVHNMFCPQCPDFPLSTLLCSVHNVRVCTVPISYVRIVCTVPISYVRIVCTVPISYVQIVCTVQISYVRIVCTVPISYVQIVCTVPISYVRLQFELQSKSMNCERATRAIGRKQISTF